MDQFFSINQKKIIQNLPVEYRQQVQDEFVGMSLAKDEEDFLLKIYAFDYDNPFETMDKLKDVLSVMRNKSGDIQMLLERDEILNIDFYHPDFDWSLFTKRVVRSVFMWSQGGYKTPAIILLERFDDITDGDFLFYGIPSEFSSVYIRSSLIVFSVYFRFLRDELQGFLLKSELLFLFIQMGLDLDKTIRFGSSEYVYPEDKQEYCRRLAFFILTNDTPVGVNSSTGEPVVMSYWIDSLRVSSNGKFSAMNVVEFFSDQARWVNINLIEKNTIKIVVTVYIQLLGYGYMLPEGDLDSIKKDISVSQSANESVNYGGIKDNLVEINNPEIIIKELEKLSTQHHDPKILELYYYDESTGEFKWKE